MIRYVPCLLVVLINLEPTMSMDMRYIMDNVNTTQSICGCNITLPVDRYKHELVSYGEVNSNCSVTVMLGLSSEFICKICVHTVEWIMEADVMNITFIGEADKKILKFGDEKFNETCFEGRRLDIRVIVDEEYARKWKDKGGAGKVFSFKFALNPNCTKIAKEQTTVPINTESTTPICLTCSNTKYAVIVGTSISIVFLLAVSFYYYCESNRIKNKQITTPETIKLVDKSPKSDKRFNDGNEDK
ncbi:uncharacterized protein [Magallana gigas]|uniref:uncharacterized protein n=1 Tax=Magallana gigas TaxID=29159 RepID=UPI00333E3947